MGQSVRGERQNGLATNFFWSDGYWYQQNGRLQAEYAGVFAEVCPDLPREGDVNEAQTGRTLKEVGENATRITGFPTAFESDFYAPLTAEMYYWAQSPE